MTFFGEVNELSSRAICWSDDEEVDDDYEIDGNHNQNDEFLVIIDLFDKNIATDHQISNIYFGLSKIDEQVNKKSCGLISIKEIDGTLARISMVNPNSVWIELNANYTQLNNHFVVKVIRSLMKQFLTQFSANLVMEPLIIIVSKQFASDEQIHYLTNNLKQVSKVVPFIAKCLPLIAPQMITNSIESAISEYSTIFGYDCIALQLPDLRFCAQNIDFIPKQIQSSILQLNANNDSSIFI